MNTRVKGNEYELKCVKYLEKAGVSRIIRNYRCRSGEVDIIGYDKDTVVFFEVKYRSSSKSGFGSEAVGFSKQRKISKVAGYYLMANHLNMDTSVRFDVLSVDGDKITWYKNAFEYV